METWSASDFDEFAHTVMTPKRTTSEPVEGTAGSTRRLIGLEERREGRERPIKQARQSTSTNTSNSVGGANGPGERQASWED